MDTEQQLYTRQYTMWKMTVDEPHNWFRPRDRMLNVIPAATMENIIHLEEITQPLLHSWRRMLVEHIQDHPELDRPNRRWDATHKITDFPVPSYGFTTIEMSTVAYRLEGDPVFEIPFKVIPMSTGTRWRNDETGFMSFGSSIFSSHDTHMDFDFNWQTLPWTQVKNSIQDTAPFLADFIDRYGIPEEFADTKFDHNCFVSIEFHGFPEITIRVPTTDKPGWHQRDVRYVFDPRKNKMVCFDTQQEIDGDPAEVLTSLMRDFVHLVKPSKDININDSDTDRTTSIPKRPSSLVTAQQEQKVPEPTSAPEEIDVPDTETPIQSNKRLKTMTRISPTWSHLKSRGGVTVALEKTKLLYDSLIHDIAIEQAQTETPPVQEPVESTEIVESIVPSAPDEVADQIEPSLEEVESLIAEALPEDESITEILKRARRSGETSDDISSLRLYLDSIGNVPLLTHEQSLDYTRQAQAGSKRAEHALWLANQRWVIALAGRYLNRGVPYMDLIQEANLGLQRAIQKFDPEKGFHFSGYSFWWIRRSLQKAVAYQSDSYFNNTHAERIGIKVQSAENTLQREGEVPTIENVALRVQMSERIVKNSKLRTRTKTPLSLHDKVGVEREEERGEFIPDPNASVEHKADGTLLQEQLEEVLLSLTMREARIIQYHYGLSGRPSRTLADIGRSFGLTRERIRQLHDQAMEKLKKKGKVHTLSAYLQHTQDR